MYKQNSKTAPSTYTHKGGVKCKSLEEKIHVVKNV